MKRNLVIFLCIALCVGIWGCKKKSSGPDTSNLSIEDFLQTVIGDWTYLMMEMAIYDTNTQNVIYTDEDSSYVVVVKDTTVNGNPAIKVLTWFPGWDFAYYDYYVFEANRILIYQDDAYDPAPFVLLQGPVEVGTEWQANPYATTGLKDMREITSLNASFTGPLGALTNLMKVAMEANEPINLARSIDETRDGQLLMQLEIGIVNSWFRSFTLTGKLWDRYDYVATRTGSGGLPPGNLKRSGEKPDYRVVHPITGRIRE